MKSRSPNFRVLTLADIKETAGWRENKGPLGPVPVESFIDVTSFGRSDANDKYWNVGATQVRFYSAVVRMPGVASRDFSKQNGADAAKWCDENLLAKKITFYPERLDYFFNENPAEHQAILSGFKASDGTSGWAFVRAYLVDVDLGIVRFKTGQSQAFNSLADASTTQNGWAGFQWTFAADGRKLSFYYADHDEAPALAFGWNW